MAEHERRESERLETKQKVVCRTSEGALPEVSLLDLSASGCQVFVRQGYLDLGQHIVVRLEGLEGLPAVVCWVEHERAGIEFARELHPSVLDHLLKTPPTIDGDMIKSRLGMLDHFGRLLPNLPPIKLVRSVA
ncbi:MAG: PilZ domain-containing protein [Pseudomonadota bacterium]